ncbi:unnamed protein product [Caenorhabditis brenneri]
MPTTCSNHYGECNISRMLQICKRFFASKVATSRATALNSSPKFPSGTSISPYAMFIKENFKADSKTKNTDMMKDLSIKWKELGVSEKGKYTEMSQKHNEKKKTDFLKLSSEEQANLLALDEEKKEEKAGRRLNKLRREKKKKEGRPTVPPSAYALYIKDQLSGVSESRDKMKEAVAQWKTLGEEQKKKYTDEAKKLKDEYFATVQKWEAEKKAMTSK